MNYYNEIKNKLIDNEIYSKIVEAIKEARNEIFAEKSGITNEEIDMLSEYPQIDRIFLGANAENSGQKESIKLVSTIIVYLVSIFIFSKISSLLYSFFSSRGHASNPSLSNLGKI